MAIDAMIFQMYLVVLAKLLERGPVCPWLQLCRFAVPTIAWTASSMGLYRPRWVPSLGHVRIFWCIYMFQLLLHECHASPLVALRRRNRLLIKVLGRLAFELRRRMYGRKCRYGQVYRSG